MLIFCLPLLILFVLDPLPRLSLVLIISVRLVFMWTHVLGGLPYSSLASLLVFILWFLRLTFFSTYSLLVLYLTFEVSLVPLVVLVLFFGYQPEKLIASSFLLVYTVVGGLPLLFFISSYSYCSISVLSEVGGGLSIYLVSLAFFIKSPLYYFHSWLPKAHTEAPLCGSIILSGVILKLGGYGILLLAPSFSCQLTLVFYLSLLGTVLCSLACLRQWDSKTLVAYSSVVHMGVVSLGALLATELGWWVSLAMLLRHSLISPLLFSVCSEVYANTHSRSIFLSKTSSSSTILTFYMALLLSINMGTPPFLRFWVELSLYVSMCDIFSLGLVLLLFSSFFVLCFCIIFWLIVFRSSSSISIRCSTTRTGYLPGIFFSLLFVLSSSLFLF